MFNDTVFWLKYNISRGFYFSLILMYCQSNVLNVTGFFFIHVQYRICKKLWKNNIIENTIFFNENQIVLKENKTFYN